MAKRLEFEGVLPSACVVWKDKSCKELDEDAYRSLLRYMLKSNINALVVGGHAGEAECLSMDERLRVLKIAKEEAGGKIPVVGGVIADSTWMAIEQGKIQKEAGADAVLFCPPTIIGWDPNTADDMMVEHVKRFDKEADIPFIFFGGPTSEGSYKILPKTFKRIAIEAENIVAWKITSRYDLGAFKACINALREAEKITGRKVAALNAGDHILVEVLREGAAGTLNGGSIYRAAEDVEICETAKRGDIAKAFELQDRVRPITDAIRGVMHGYSHTYFHYRYKVAAWLMGKIPRPHMRLPMLPVSLEEVQILRGALIESGMKPVIEAEPIEVSET
ncbi:dihydrodipicolinate synthase family protein [Thermodesulfobacteriota bacterium]